LAVELNRVSDCLYHAKIRMAKGAGRVRGKGVELHLKLDLDAAGALVVMAGRTKERTFSC
jgi:hypothetical protein